MIYGVEIDRTQTRIYFDEDDVDTILKIIEELSPYVEGYQFTQQYRSGIWDGRKKFFTMPKNIDKLEKKYITTFTGLAKNLAKKYNFEIKSNLQDTYYSKEEIIEFINSLNLPFEPYDYQIDAVIDIIQKKRLVAVLATGAGKSLIIYMALRFLFSKGKKTLLIVPNVSLTEQIYNDFREYCNLKNPDEDEFIRECHKIYSGELKTLAYKVTISTWQSFIRMLDNPSLKEIDGVFIDEAHLVSDIENSLSKILKALKNTEWKVGLTGTIPDNQIARMSLYALLGELDVKVRPIDLINMGRATPVEINAIFFKHPKEQVRGIKTYQKEVKYLEEHIKRNKYIAKIAVSVTKKYGNSIILGNKLKHLELLIRLLYEEKTGTDYKNVVFIPHLTNIKMHKYKDSEKIVLYQTKAKNLENYDNIVNINDLDIYYMVGEVDKKHREWIRQILNEKEEAILVGNYQVLSTGINIKRLNNLILASSTKSFVRVMQSIGRGMRLHETKDKLRVYDIVDEFDTYKKNYMSLQFLERLNNSYLFSGFPIKEKVVKL